jgi:hypothetical protein
MPVIIEGKVKIDDHFVKQCEHLRNEVAALLKAGSECTTEEAETLMKSINMLRDSISIQCPNYWDETPRPEIGSEIEVWRFERGDVVIGTVLVCKGDKVKVQVPERIIPARTEKIIPGFTVTADWEDEHDQWVDWSEEAEEDESDE